MDFELIIDGLQVSGIGMGMTTAVLIILAVSVRVVSWTDAMIRRRETERAAKRESETSDAEASQAEEVLEESDGPARAAAIGVALALSQLELDTAETTRNTTERIPNNAIHDTWLTEGRARQHSRHGAPTRNSDRR